MRVISHRGNIDGPDPREENTIVAVERAINLGFDVEVDLWRMENGDWRLGHDDGLVRVELSWMLNLSENLWVHCKNMEALHSLSRESNGLNFFWHDSDSFTLTSKGIVWAYPSNRVFSDFINVLPERHNLTRENLEISARGVCTDFPLRFQS